MRKGKAAGWLAISPLILFLGIYFTSSMLAGDFNRIPVASAFLLASVFAVCISHGSISGRLAVFSISC